jgi:mono/diheme cytochrome c family protein
MRRFFPALLLLLPLLVLAKQPTRRPPERQRGWELYRDNCFQCHGQRGGGRGPLSRVLGTPPPNIAQRFAEADFPAQIRVIMRGHGDMPGFSQVMNRGGARKILQWLEDPKPMGKGKGKGKGKRGRRGKRGAKAPPVTPPPGMFPEADAEVPGDQAGGDEAGDNEAGRNEAGGGDEARGGGDE